MAQAVDCAVQASQLGADAVLIGRPFVNMVYGGGAEGVKVLTGKLKGELADAMAMCGAHSPGGDSPGYDLWVLSGRNSRRG